MAAAGKTTPRVSAVERGFPPRPSSEAAALPSALVLVVHAGCRVDSPDRTSPRFPQSRVEAVAAELGAVLDRLRPDTVVTAAAAGADLLMVEQSLRRGIPIHLLLPFQRSRFREESVADLGERWTAVYDGALAAIDNDPRSSVEELDLPVGEDAYRRGNEALIERALDTGGPDVVAVVVRPPGGESPPSLTDDFASRAGAALLPIVEVDPTSRMG